MLELFTVFSKGGIVLWQAYNNTNQSIQQTINHVISNVILQERDEQYVQHEGLTVRYRLENEFDLVFAAAHQSMLNLSYVDKLLTEVVMDFKNTYRTELSNLVKFWLLPPRFTYDMRYKSVLAAAEEWGRAQAKIPKNMRTFEQSAKSKKTVASMIERKNGDSNKELPLKKEVNFAAATQSEGNVNENSADDTLAANRAKFFQKMGKRGDSTKKVRKSPIAEKSSKKPRVWALAGNNKDLCNLERTLDKPMGDHLAVSNEELKLVGQMKGGIKDLEVDSDSNDTQSDDESDAIDDGMIQHSPQPSSTSMMSLFKSLIGHKSLTRENMQPALEKMRELLITKNVAADIASKLCESVAGKLDGKVIGTFGSIARTVKTALTDALVQILSARRRIDILRDCLEARRRHRPYVITFCGVNGVGKSTNLAKICFWLIENDLRVLIAACDTFRAGAVEQLRTHTRHLNALHPPQLHGGKHMVELYEKGYGKDAAGIAMEALRFAAEAEFDVVLIDTAGRMQDNEPLMRALTKLIKVNDPDLVLFVGEALVGNEAVDQLMKFNQALADYSSSSNPHVIDGIVLTKFDTIDDKVGAAISMTYTTGQPIIFVGTGQTYTDLKALNAKAVVHSLMK